MPDFFNLEWAVADHEAIAHVMEEANLRVKISRSTSGAVSKADDSLVGKQFDEEPFAVTDRWVDIIEEDSFVTRYGDARCSAVLGRGLTKCRTGGHASTNAGGGQARVVYKATSVDAHPRYPFVVSVV